MNDRSILARLKIETRPHHQQTETRLYARKLMAGTLTRTEYGHLIGIHYRFHQALETAVATQSGFFAGYDRETRRKTPWLVTDLERLGLPLPSPRPGLFADWNGYQLLGALYVAEGATLGGQVVDQALRRIPDLEEAAVPSRFFGGYGDQTRPHWQAFGTYLTERAREHHDEVVDAAGRAFDYFSELAGPPTVPARPV
ncbi:biliverdin-producing heme oxygenase [Spirosoma pollinicola]|uniref:biliverdin-producing heme oxygenase n=1 Tax=Spirosoma pollinicola TaxID=2057025 RepID=UPI0012FD2279|nr:biliverdin-producing heme oxygenase [Spirosoma pollinicola]